VKGIVGALLGVGSLVAAVLSLRLVSRYVVEGRSMLRAYAPGDRLLVERLTYRLRQPRVGEAVVVRREGRLDLKRIAAAPGAEVTLRGGPYVLDADEWFLLGDNLSESADSREQGPVKTQDIVGRAWFRY
jgi:signal peptidase I